MFWPYGVPGKTKGLPVPLPDLPRPFPSRPASCAARPATTAACGHRSRGDPHVETDQPDEWFDGGMKSCALQAADLGGENIVAHPGGPALVIVALPEAARIEIDEVRHRVRVEVGYSRRNCSNRSAPPSTAHEYRRPRQFSAAPVRTANTPDIASTIRGCRELPVFLSRTTAGARPIAVDVCRRRPVTMENAKHGL